MQIRLHQQTTELPKLKCALVGEPKYGKTRFATSLPWDEMGERAVLVAWDEAEDPLAPVLLENREHVISISPSPKIVRDKVIFDPHKEAIAIATKPWATGFTEGDIVVPPCQTLIWDTMTETARNLLAAYADSGLFSGDKHISIGEQGTPYYMAQPMMGDYGLAQRAVMHILRILFKQPMNIIVIFHTDFMEPEGAGQVTFGPATVGKAAIKPVASMFDNLFMLDAQERLQKGNPPTRVMSRRLYTDKKGLYLAGLRSPYPKNPIPELEVGDNPVDVWRTINRVRRGEYK